MFSWGWGAKGQLGNGSYENEYYPKLVVFESPLSNLKAVQVHAGYRHSIALMDDPTKKIFWWGTNSELKGINMAKRLELSKKA